MQPALTTSNEQWYCSRSGIRDAML